MVPDSHVIAAAASALASASASALLLGDRVAEARAVDGAVRLAEVLGSAVYVAQRSEVNFPTGHPLFRGMLPAPVGLEGTILDGIDVVLAAGTSVLGGFFYLPGRAFARATRLIHLDSDPSEIGRNERTEIGIPGDIAAGLSALHRAVDDAVPADDPRRRTARRGPPISARQPDHPAISGENAPLTAEELMVELSRSLPANAVVVEDGGTAAGALHRAIEFNETGRLHGVRGGALGWGMGAALGVQLADPARRVIGVVGDGTAAMTVQALWTAVRERLPVVYLVCNNASYRVLEDNSAMYRDIAPEADSSAPNRALIDLQPRLDFAELAVAFGLRGRRIVTAREAGPALREAVARREPTLLDAVIDGRG